MTKCLREFVNYEFYYLFVKSTKNLEIKCEFYGCLLFTRKMTNAREISQIRNFNRVHYSVGESPKVSRKFVNYKFY